jgi:hypothetical protein
VPTTSRGALILLAVMIVVLAASRRAIHGGRTGRKTK